MLNLNVKQFREKSRVQLIIDRYSFGPKLINLSEQKKSSVIPTLNVTGAVLCLFQVVALRGVSRLSQTVFNKGKPNEIVSI